MISSSREKSFQAKQEGHNNNDGNSTSSFKASSSTTTTSSRQWSGFRNPRIVRVSRTFGGKDRHSKVSTVRGLRDRRIRLSVPTAVQLYDLQDRLGLSQPSKVIDWLLDATEHDIDKLPPLQVPHGFGHQFHQQHMLNPQSNNSLAAPFFDVNSTFMQNIEADHQAELLLHDHQHQRSSTTSNVRVLGDQKGKSIKTNADEQDHDGQNRDHQQDGNNVGGQLLAQKLFPMGNYPSSIPGLLNNGMAYNYVHNYSEPSSLSLSQFGSHGFTPQIDYHMMSNALPFSSSMPTGSHQLFFCPSTATPSLFAPYPSYITNPVVESSSTTYTNEPRTSQANSHFQFLSSSSSQNFLHNAFVPSLHSVSSSLRSFPTLVNPKQLHSNSQHNNGSQPNKDTP